jgi:hypothetical protein
LFVVLSSCGAETPSTGDDDDASTNSIVVSEGKGGGADLFAAMLAAQEAAGSYRFEMHMDIEGASVDASGAAAYQYGTDIDQVDMTMTMSMPLDDLDPDAGSGQLEMLLVDGQLYLSFPPELGLPVDKPWLTVDPEGVDPISQAFGMMSDLMADSAALQRRLTEQAEVIAVEELGSDTVDGIAVTRYRITLSVDDLVELMEIPGMEGMSAEDAPFDEAEYTLWLDSDLLLRKMEAGLDGMMFMDMRLFDIGEPVDVEAPPADQVGELADVMAGAGTASA